MPRKVAAAILVPVAAVALALALITGYVDRAVFDSTQFANRATDALETAPVKSKAATAITDDLVLKANADLIGLRPLIQSVSESIIGSGAFRSLFHRAVADVHATLVNGNRHTGTLALADVGTLITEALAKVNPGAVPKIGGRVPRIRISIQPPEGLVTAIQDLHKLQVLPPALLIFGVVCAAVGIGLAPDRRRAIVRGGITAAVAGIVLLLLYHVARVGVLHQVPAGSRGAAAAIWDSFCADLRTALLIFAGAGVVLAAAASSVLRPVDIALPLRRGWEIVAKVPARTAPRLARAAALVAVGIFVIVERQLVLELVLLLIGAYLVYVGVTEVLRVGTPAAQARAPVRRRRLVGVALASVLAVLVIGGAATAFVTSGGLNAPARDTAGTCNGFKVLCSRTLDEVALPATHNAMSAAAIPGWLFANQAQAIPAQLSSGIRALLWDTYYGRRAPSGQVKTVLEGRLGRAKRQQYVQEVGKPLLDAALRIRDRLPRFKGTGGPPQMYLCHGFCEIGALPLSKGLAQVRDFLVAHPTQVLVIVNEDYVKPADYVAAVRKAGLADFVYKGSTGSWPTLGEMVDSNQRLVLLAEKHSGGAPWYHPAYKGILQETPYKFTDPAQLDDRAKVPASCVPHRGGRRGSLFLLNNFITHGVAPKPSVAEQVNAYGPLLHRARVCERRRDAFPNILAVDFSTAGDVVGVANALNDVGGGGAS